MTTIPIDGMTNGYTEVLEEVLTFGDDVEARGYNTKELRNLRVINENPLDNVPWDDDDPRIELLNSEIKTILLGQKPDVQFPELNDKLDLDDGTFYEDVIRERISQDYDEWIRLLKEDPATRKACSLFGSEPDPPCTSRIQFLIRDYKLHCYTYNRSQDMLFAWPMDMGLFGELHYMVAEELNVPVGRHEHVMTSAHIYEEDFDEVQSLI